MENLAFQAAKQYLAAGVSVLPIELGGKKSPTLNKWGFLMQRLPTAAEISNWFKDECGIATISGKVSGNLECLDIESTEVFEMWKADINQEAPGLLEKLVITETPGGKFDSSGWHIRYRVDGECLRSGKLAHTSEGKTLAEIKGEGGYALAPGSSPKAHDRNKTYINRQGRITDLKVITADERDLLVSLAAKQNQLELKEEAYEPKEYTGDGTRPGDLFNQRGDFSFLSNYGWKFLGGSSGIGRWKRPGKDEDGISATTGFCKGKDGTPRLFVFSTNASPFRENKYYSPFAALAYLKHGGDFKAARRDVADQLGIRDGYGPVTISNHLPDDIHQDDGEVEDDLIKRELFPVGVFPESLQLVIEEQSRSIPAPKDTVGTLLLGIAAIGVGNTRKIRLKRNWSEPASLYIAVVAPPGQGKTPVMQQLDKPMNHWQDMMNDQYKSQIADYKQEKEKYEEAKKRGDDVVEPIKPKYHHIFTTDATTEKLAEMLNDQPRGIGINQDEVTALVQGMNQYKQGGKGRDRQFFLSSWSGANIKVDRKSDGGIPLWVKNPVINIIGGIQPEMLGSLKDELGREDGFVHRFLFTYPPLRELKDWGDDEIDERAITAWESCFQKLTTLSLHTEPDGKMRPWQCTMTPEAVAQWKKWYDKTIESMPTLQPQFIGPYHKLIAYAARLSLVMQMLYWASGEGENQRIEAKAVWAGCKLADYYTSHMKLVYTSLHDKADDVKAKEMLKWVNERGGKASTTEVLRFGPNWARKTTAAIKSFRDLEDRGLGKYYETKADSNGKTAKWFESTKEVQNDQDNAA